MWENNDDKPISEMTVGQLEGLCQQIAEQRKTAEEKKALYKLETDKLDSLEKNLLNTLKAMGRNNYPSKVGTFSISHRMSVKLPATPEERKAFFAYLQERGLYDSMVSVNSNTLNAFYKKEFEIANEEGRGLDFAIPGVGEPTLNEIMAFKAAK